MTRAGWEKKEKLICNVSRASRGCVKNVFHVTLIAISANQTKDAINFLRNVFVVLYGYSAAMHAIARLLRTESREKERGREGRRGRERRFLGADVQLCIRESCAGAAIPGIFLPRRTGKILIFQSRALQSRAYSYGYRIFYFAALALNGAC